MFASSALLVALAITMGGENDSVGLSADVVIEPVVVDSLAPVVYANGRPLEAPADLNTESRTFQPQHAELVSSVDYLGGEPVQQHAPIVEVCGDGCCCDSCGWGAPGGPPFWDQRFYPSPCFSPGNMPLHIPYIAEPKNYYYFRPYNWFHIRDHQQEVMLYSGDPRHPYANEVFQQVYQNFDETFSEQ